jgi:hypothetical protein
MTHTKDEALQMCLEYIETDAHERKYVRHAIKQALAAQPAVQEPVALLNGIKRYEPEIFREDRIRMELDQSGEWVKYADVELLIATPPAAQPAVQEPVAWEDGSHLVVRSDMRERLNYKGPWVDMGRAIPDAWVPVLYTTPPAQPAVPDALTSADIQEHIEYVAGWNDCRAEMLKGMK